MDAQTRYDTNDVPPGDRLAYWRESVCASYVQLGCEVEKTPEFRGVIEIAKHNVLSISRVSGQQHRVRRRNRDIRSATESYFLLSLQTSNVSSVSQFGKTAVLRPGDMALYASTAPYTLQLTDDFSQTVVQLPASKLLERLPNAELLTACRIDGQAGIGKLVGENVLAFADHINSPNAMLQALVQDTLIDLIATGVAAHGSHKLELSSPEQHVMLRAKSFIRANLNDPNLDRNRVALDVGMSVRRLNDIFSKQDESISAFIRRMRLERVSADLSDPRYAQQTISEIAFRHGFSNSQNFSTTFRNHFGESPRSYRARQKA
ncbi:helix-turn-helix domain-containing protein [Thalassococcus sp. S3]|uniref:AraC-like ligand-binding domain-containing protein n=1 Tax=Thalassococcus sp. S3 TaxID=2017482 RepID=UPI0010244261|nr:helix-turn-helix domain-containing protein [Thalassococcus sp. S3]QBF31476.1 AraC family transcriptional regulator [Thalassococcus sp. S3]